MGLEINISLNSNTGTNCAINSPQPQGDGSANSPTNLQITRSTEEEPTQSPGPGRPGGRTAILLFDVLGECPEGHCPTRSFQHTVAIVRDDVQDNVTPDIFNVPPSGDQQNYRFRSIA